MIAHAIELSVFSTPEDDESRVYSGLLSLVPFNLEQEKLKIQKRNASGFSERKIVIMSLSLTKQRHITQFLEHLLGLLTEEQKELLLRQAESRLDENLYFFLRLDKGKLVEENKCWVTGGGSCYHIKIALSTFPRKREKAIEQLKSIFANPKAI